MEKAYEKLKEGCQNCKHNRERTIREKTCSKGYRAVYGFHCNKYQRKMGK